MKTKYTIEDEIKELQNQFDIHYNWLKFLSVNKNVVKRIWRKL